MKRKIAVIAFGGSAILPQEQGGLQSEPMKNTSTWVISLPVLWVQKPTLQWVSSETEEMKS